MATDPFLIRARRAALRGPRYVVGRVLEPARRPSRRLWTRAFPRLLSDAVLLRLNAAASVDDLWRKQQTKPFFFTAADRANWTAAFERTFPTAPRAILAAAEAALRHEFDLLGSGPQLLGDRLPWHTDFKTGREWPAEYACDIQYSELDRPTDVKVPWELSRCQHFTALGQAYWLSGDERYAREFVDEVDDWIDRNPWGFGVNWACAMDVALRAISWLWAFYYFADAKACRSAGFRGRFLRSLFLHGEHIATHLERGDVNGNHYLCDGVGLVFLGLFFSASARGRRWLELGRSIVLSEIELQTYEDGVDFEQSTAYHRLVLEGFTTAYMLLRVSGERVPEPQWRRLERMLEFVDAYTKPDGTVPLIGDADDGRIQKLGHQAINDHRYLLSTGTVLFDRADWVATAGRFWEESFWLLGPAGFEAFARTLPAPSAASRAFPAGGVFVLRSADAHVIVDCAEVGMRGRGGHGHNDILSFELWMNGVNWVSDCGAYLYTASREWRNRFRSTSFHNTVQIDGAELNQFIAPDALWQLHYDAVPIDATLACAADVDRFSGGHIGYERLPHPVTVRREIALCKATRPSVRIVDTLSGDGTHVLASRFHLDPSVETALYGRAIRLRSHGRDLWVGIEAATDLSISLEPGWISPSYGVKLPTTTILCGGTVGLPAALIYTFSESRPSCASS